MFYKFIGENTIRACPTSGYANGRAISNLPRYFEKNPEIAKAEGYKELELTEKPDVDNETQYLTVTYENTDEAILQHWVVNERPPIEEIVEESVEERLDKAEKKLVEFDKKFKATEIMLFGEGETNGD